MTQPEAIQSVSWVFFDRIYCISLEERPDRREQARKQFASVGMVDRVEFVIVKKHPDNPVLGIFQSHLRCLAKGLEAGANHILVFEDDVFFQGFDEHTLKQACTHLDSLSDWDGFFLGGISDGSCKTGQPSLVKINYRCLTHGYALNNHFARRIVRETWCGSPYDEVLRQSKGDFYALYPMCAFQGLEGTDNQTVAIDRIRRLFGGLPFIQKANEKYQNHKLLLIAAPLIGIVGLAVFVYQLVG